MPSLLEERRAASSQRLEALRARLSATEAFVADRACVYVTGSFGRGEAGDYSDLDAFIVGGGTDTHPMLDASARERVRADLIAAADAERFPPFTDDAKYLEHHTIGGLTSELGSRTDDSGNTFTARLLLLLESKVLIGAPAYRSAIAAVVGEYWRDFDGHRDDFLPAFLVNDILRLWRTFCVNYEAGRKGEPPEERAKAHLKRYKLKHSRLMTCYSAIAYLMALHGRDGTVTPREAIAMVAMTPTERLEVLARDYGEAVGAEPISVIELYERFLKHTHADKERLLGSFGDEGYRRTRFEEATRFQAAIVRLMEVVPASPRFRSVLIV